MRRTKAVGLQALRNDPQEDTQHHIKHQPVALHEVAQSFGNRQHPLAHRQARENVIRQMRSGLHPGPGCYARGTRHGPCRRCTGETPGGVGTRYVVAALAVDLPALTNSS